MAPVIIIIGIIAIILVICSKVLNILVGSICIIGGLIFNSYLGSADSLEFRLEMALEEGISTSDLSSYSTIIIVVGVILLIIGIIRLITSKKNQNNINNYYVQNSVPANSIFCGKCGSRNDANSVFCASCGEKIEKEENQEETENEKTNKEEKEQETSTIDAEVVRLKKIKELFDNGDITKEEYEEKRKSILEKI